MDAASDPNRDHTGKFVAGNKAAVGNKGGGAPSKEHIRKFNKAIRSEVTDADLEEIVRTAIGQAKEGDRFARQWLWDRVVGKAMQQIAHLDGDETDLTRLLSDLREVYEDEDEGDDDK